MFSPLLPGPAWPAAVPAPQPVLGKGNCQAEVSSGVPGDKCTSRGRWRPSSQRPGVGGPGRPSQWETQGQRTRVIWSMPVPFLVWFPASVRGQWARKLGNIFWLAYEKEELLERQGLAYGNKGKCEQSRLRCAISSHIWAWGKRKSSNTDPVFKILIFCSSWRYALIWIFKNIALKYLSWLLSFWSAS